MLTGASCVPAWRQTYDSLQAHEITVTENQRALLQKSSSAVMRRDVFLESQLPYLELRRPFILGTQKQKWKPTLTHWFARFLERENKLTRVFAQNIDGLNKFTGIASGLVCNMHGDIGEASCAVCNADMCFDSFCDEVRVKIKDIYACDPDAPAESSHIICQSCGGPTMKPSTKLFGDSLTKQFTAHAKTDLPRASLLIVAGTSLTASPANKLVQMVPSSCPRLFVSDQDMTIGRGSVFLRDDGDIVVSGQTCDKAFLDLALLLSWQEHLLACKDKLSPDIQDQLSRT